MSSDILNIALLGMSDKTATTFSYFVRRQASQYVKLTDASKADIFITDFDNESGVNDWRTYSNCSGKPSILLASENPNKKNSIWIRKPVVSSSLLEAIPQLIQLSRTSEKQDENSEGAKKPAHKQVDISSGESKKNKSGYNREFSDGFSPNLTLSKDELIENCGSREDTDLNDPKFKLLATFDEKSSLLASFKEAINLAKKEGMVVYIEGLPFEVAILPNEERVFIDLNNRHLRHICIMPLKALPRFKTVKMSVRDYKTTFPIAVKEMPTIEQVIWQVTLWCARGRLIQTLNPKSRFIMTAWPNFTRLQITPYAVQIASIWTQHAMTPDEVASTVQVPQRYVYAVASACQSIGYLREEKSSFGRPNRVAHKTKTGFLNTILRSLRIV